MWFCVWGAREKKQLLLEAMERKEYPFSIVGDIKKAHRRFKHLAEEHGFLACQLDFRDGPEGQLDDSCVYVNKVGTFGVNCASHWWTRIAACGVRATHHLLGPCPIDMLLYADDLESLATTKRGRIAPAGSSRDVRRPQDGQAHQNSRPYESSGRRDAGRQRLP